MPISEKLVSNKSFFRKALRVLGWLTVIFVGLILLLLLALQTDYVQNLARTEIVSYLNKKIQTKVEVGRLRVDFPKTVVLEDVYIQDQLKDTLLYGDLIKVDVEMVGLIFNELNINEVQLTGITAKIKRLEPDTIFNFQFIIDAFKPPGPKIEKDTASAMKMSLDHIIINDTKIVYQDIITGNDVDVYIGKSEIEMSTFDPTNLVFDIPNINIDGLKGKINQTAAIEMIVKSDDSESTIDKFLHLSNKKTSLKNIDISYNNEVSALETRFIMTKADIYPEEIDLENTLIKIKELDIHKLVAKVSLNSSSDSELVQLTTTTGKDVAINYLPWKVLVGKIKLSENDLVFDDNTKPKLNKGMDFAHLDLSKLNFEANDFVFHRDTVSIDIIKADVVEKSGFVLNQFHTNLFYTDKGAVLKGLLIKTPGSEIKRNIKVSYPSLAAAMADYSLIKLQLDIDNSQIQVADILSFVPRLSQQPAFKNSKNIFHIDADIDGSLDELYIRKFLLKGFGNTRVDVDGVIQNVLDTNRIFADLNINNLSTSIRDLKLLSPPNTLPKTIDLPELMSMSGHIKGGMNDLIADLDLRSSLGDASIKGNIKNLKSPKLASYQADMSILSFQVGKLIQQGETLGKITAQLSVIGTGYDPNIAKADISANINSAVYKKYNYKDIILNANLDRQQFKTNGFIKDPNIHISFLGEGELNKSYPCIMVIAEIDSIKTGPLNLTKDPIIYRGHVEADFPVLSLDSLQGQAYISNSLIVINNRRLSLDSIILESKYDTVEQSLTARADFAQVMLKGKYKLSELDGIFMSAIEPYYELKRDTFIGVSSDYDFKISGYISDHPSIRALYPELKRMSTVTLDGAFSPTAWNVSTTLPNVIYGTSKVSNLVFSAVEKDDELKVQLNAAEIKNGDNLNLINTRFHTQVTIDKIIYALRIGDKLDVDRYIVQGNILREPNDIYDLNISSDSLMLNYAKWDIKKDNSVRFGSNILEAREFDLSKDEQHLIISNENATYRSPLKVQFDNFGLGNLTGFLQKDSLII